MGTFFFSLSLFTFENDRNLFWVYQNGDFLREKTFHGGEKFRKNDFAPSEKYACYTPLIMYKKMISHIRHIIKFLLFLRTHSHSSWPACRFHIMQYRCGYCKLQYLWRYFAATAYKVAPFAVAAGRVPSRVIQPDVATAVLHCMGPT